MGNNQQPSNAKYFASNESRKSQKPTLPSPNTEPQVTASAAGSGAADGRLTKSSGEADSDSLWPHRGSVPPSTLQKSLDKGHLPPDAASSSKKTPRPPQDFQGKQKLDDLEQMYAQLMLKLSKMDCTKGSTPVCLSYKL